MDGRKPDGNEPFVDTFNENGTEVLGIFCDADIYAEWDDFKQQAKIAKAAALLQESPITDGCYIKNPNAQQLAKDPLFLFEDQGGVVIIWLNSTIKTKVDYLLVKSQANDLRLKYEQLAARYGRGVAKAQLDVQWTRYASSDNEPDLIAEIENLLQ